MAKGYVRKAASGASAPTESSVEGERELQLQKKEGELKRREEELRVREEEVKRMRMNSDAQLATSREALERAQETNKRVLEMLAMARKPNPNMFGCLDEGKIRWNVPVAEITERGSKSLPTTIGGTPFSLHCKSRAEGGQKVLACHIRCNDEVSNGNTGYTKVVATLLLQSSELTEVLTKEFVFRRSSRSRGWSTLLPWTDVIDPEQGFIHDGLLTIEAEIKVICLYKNAFPDFTAPDALSDVTLVVGGSVFHGNKMHLARYSGYFKASFLSGFAEQNKSQIELPNVDPDEFKDILGMIYPQREKVKVMYFNVDYLLRLADYFDMPCVLWECIDYLKETTDFSLAAKLLRSEQYHVPELQEHLLQQLNNQSALRAIVTSPDLRKLSTGLQNLILMKHLKLPPIPPPSPSAEA